MYHGLSPSKFDRGSVHTALSHFRPVRRTYDRQLVPALARSRGVDCGNFSWRGGRSYFDCPNIRRGRAAGVAKEIHSRHVGVCSGTDAAIEDA